MNGGRLPLQSELRIERLGPATVPSPLRERGAHFARDERRILVAADTAQLVGGGEASPAFEPAGPRELLFFAPASASCALVTCGGLCPGTNDVIRSLVLTLWHAYGVRRLLGYRYGFAGLNPESGFAPQALDPEVVHDIHTAGGTILGSSRGPQDPEVMADTLERDRVDVLYVIGGDGSLRGAAAIDAVLRARRLDIAVVAIPKTIDNDIAWIQRSFGFATAVNEAARAIVAAHTEAHGAINGVGLVKLMGRNSGCIAAHATLAHPHVNFCLVPEVPFDIDGPGGFLDCLQARLLARQHAVVLVAEGAGQEHLHGGSPRFDASGNLALGDIGVHLRDRIREHFAARNFVAEVKYIDPSYLIRSMPADSFDSALCLAFGQHAAHAGMAGCTGMLVGTWQSHFTHVPLALAASARQQLDANGEVWEQVLQTTGQPRSMRSTVSAI